MKNNFKDVQLSDLIQIQYKKARENYQKGRLDLIKSPLNLYQMASIHASYNFHAKASEDKLYKLFIEASNEMDLYITKGMLNPTNSYAKYAFCFLKTLELENLIKKPN